MTTTRKQYDDVKARVEQLIAEATQKGMLEPDMDNDYTREISLLSRQMAEYEDTQITQQQMVKESLTRAFDELHSGKAHHDARNLFKAVAQAERDLEEGKCLSEAAFNERFAKWL